MNSEKIEALKKQFPNAILEEKTEFGETALILSKGQLISILHHLKNDLKFEKLTDVTGVDYLEPHKHTKVVYFLRQPATGENIRLAVLLERQEPIPSITDLWRGADWYERELFDLFGVMFEGKPNMERILMPDDWQGHPLRKDYALTEVPVEFKHGVKPKVPSEIIPYVKNRPKF